MQFLYRGHPTTETQENPPADLMDAIHGDYAKAHRYYAQGIFRQLWDMDGGVIALCEADTREQLDALIRELPMVKSGMIEHEIHEITPFSGFGPDSKSD